MGPKRHKIFAFSFAVQKSTSYWSVPARSLGDILDSTEKKIPSEMGVAPLHNPFDP